MKVIVTGATGALGRATVEQLRGEGHSVVGMARAVPAESDPEVTWIACDLVSPEATAAAVAKAISSLGGLDAIVHVAGGFAHKKVEEGIIGEWRRLQQVNVETALNLLVAAIPELPNGGAIVTIGAASAARAAAGMAPYTAAKAGIARLTEALAGELAPRRIRVNAILPQTIDTPDNRAAMPGADPGKWTSPEAIAEVIAFLIGPQARAINGALIPVTNVE